jgi:hypothetical protein
MMQAAGSHRTLFNTKLCCVTYQKTGVIIFIAIRKSQFEPSVIWRFGWNSEIWFWILVTTFTKTVLFFLFIVHFKFLCGIVFHNVVFVLCYILSIVMFLWQELYAVELERTRWSPWWLNFVLQHLIFVGPCYETWLYVTLVRRILRWLLDFWKTKEL